MKFLKVFTSLLLACVLVGCRGRATNSCSVLKSVKTEINKTYSDEESKLGLEKTILINTNSKYKGSDKLSGTVYVMVTKDKLDKMSKNQFKFNGDTFEDVGETSDDDFNIRYDGKTFWPLKKVSIKEVSVFNISSNWNGKILVAIRK